MNFCRLFIMRPVATILLALSLFVAGAICYPLMPVASLPDIGSSTINVEIEQPGASPEQMVSSVTTPLERYLGQIAGGEADRIRQLEQLRLYPHRLCRIPQYRRGLARRSGGLAGGTR
ncbi:efflux RND transporter permease subunit [Asaia astilbis]|uniref:efflux RND transporter permease subunit n=1 Tax=Asaia astilbis TaxID=610244 RepID=UPI000AEA2289|nr:efflux RND transporter permease subunit [Asaia astilbis]